MNYILLAINLILLLVGCSGEQFSASEKNGSIAASPVETYEVSSCASRTVNKPPVDLLYLVDNSSSVNFLNETLRNSIASSMANLSQDFDYRAIVAPLIPESNEQNLTSFLKFASDGVYADQNDDVYTAYQLASVYQPFTQLVGGASELGLKRTYDIINANIGFFRKGAYTQVVLISNGDDNEAVYVNGYLDVAATNNKLQQRINDLKKFTRKYYDTLPAGTEKNNALRSEEFRFLTLVPHSSCKSGFIDARRYRDVSRQIYNYVTNSSLPSGSIVDSVDICSGDYNNLLSQISNNISSITVPHVYNWWPLAPINSFDQNHITVRKSNGVVCNRDDLSNGFRYDNQYRINRETRESPAPPSGELAEPYTGYLIELFGNCKVVWPECLHVTLQNPPVYRGYLDLEVAYTPDISQAVIKVNGQVIPRISSSNPSNGWEYVGSFAGNIYIAAPDDFVSAPAEVSLDNGPHFIRFRGSSTPSKQDEVTWSVPPL